MLKSTRLDVSVVIALKTYGSEAGSAAVTVDAALHPGGSKINVLSSRSSSSGEFLKVNRLNDGRCIGRVDLGKSVCLLKDRTLKSLHTDLVGRLYEAFDPQRPSETIPQVLEKWLRDRSIVA